ncbi:MAG: aspartate kinase [Ramlibacter sp.]|nr:aspartate kinase [Ramlibacter sp.]
MKNRGVLSVMKFGGSSFASQAHFVPICQWIHRHLRELEGDHRVICIVSAPSGLTEKYRETLLALNPMPTSRLIDAGLPLADSLGAVFVAAALQAAGVSATVALGNQIGLRTDRNYTRARLHAVETDALAALLEEHQVIVVPGGQASAADTGETTWLGKNSSDLSAIALAAALECENVEIYSDVPGVYSCDPNIVPEAYLLPQLPHAQAVEMSRSGAKVLHHRGVEHALQHRLRIVCRSNRDDFSIGTILEVAGLFQSTVIPDARSQVFSGPIAVINIAAQELEAIAVPCLLVLDNNDINTSRLVVTCGYFDAPHFLVAGRQFPLICEDTRLISVIKNDGSILRELVPPSQLAARARELHKSHCKEPFFPVKQSRGESSSASEKGMDAQLAVFTNAEEYQNVRAA